MASILEQLVVLFPLAELHVIHLAIDLFPSDLDAAAAQLIGWGCDFEPEAPSPSVSLLPQRLLRPQRLASVKRSSAASQFPLQPSGAIGCWTSETLVSWGHRPWLELYASCQAAYHDRKHSNSTQLWPEFPCRSPLAARCNSRRSRACSRITIGVCSSPRLPLAPHRVFMPRGCRHVLSFPSSSSSHGFLRPQFCEWALFAVAGASSSVILLFGALCAWLHGPETRILTSQISGEDGSRCFSPGRA